MEIREVKQSKSILPPILRKWIGTQTGKVIAWTYTVKVRYYDHLKLRPLHYLDQPLSVPYVFQYFWQIDICKQCRPRSDCPFRSSLIRVYTVCHFTKYFKKLLHKRKDLTKKVSNKVLESLGHLLYFIFNTTTNPTNDHFQIVPKVRNLRNFTVHLNKQISDQLPLSSSEVISVPDESEQTQEQDGKLCRTEATFHTAHCTLV